VAAAMVLLCGMDAPSRGQETGGAASPAKGEKRTASIPSEDVKLGKKLKKALDPGAAKPTPGVKKPRPLQFPLGVSDSAKKLKIPETDRAGALLSLLMAAKATRVDDEHVQMSEMNLDLYHPDGKEDFHIIMPTSIFNLKTRIISSDDPVTVRTQDFELTGEKMEFNTVERTGKLMGKVRMLVHNLKQVAGGSNSEPKTE
jgi:hypothetical protein